MTPEIKCKYDQLVKLSELAPSPQNPNQHPAIQIELYAAILKFQGIRQPVRVSKRSGFITKGHGLLEAAKYMNLESLPVEFQDYADEEQEIADMIADNQLARHAALDNSKLQEMLVQLDTGALDMKVTGFSDVQLEKLFNEFGISRPALELSSQEGVLASHPELKSSSGELQTPDLDSDIHSPARGSHVRMVQLFFNEETQAEFLSLVEKHQPAMKTENVTDTVLALLRAYDALAGQ